MGVFHGRIIVKTILKSAAAAAVLLSFASIAPAQAAARACLITKTDNRFFGKLRQGSRTRR
jgi:ABC-type sugar transport system substrate-binding protein